MDIPGDIDEFLAEHPDADGVFRALAPSHRKEFLDWITAAKKPETRRRRLSQMAERLTERKTSASRKPAPPGTLPSLTEIVARLRAETSPVDAVNASEARTPFELIIWENVAYLADDDRRLRAFELLRSTVGLAPQDLLSASDEALLAVARHGIVPEQTVGKLRRIGEIAASEFPDGVDAVVALPVKDAMRALKKFRAIGDPAAEKILLFCRAHPILALESNGLRVLQRIGFGTDTGNYAADYKAVKASGAATQPSTIDGLIDAYRLLRRHGQQVCRRSTPDCAACRLRDLCAYNLKDATK